MPRAMNTPCDNTKSLPGPPAAGSRVGKSPAVQTKILWLARGGAEAPGPVSNVDI